MAKGKYLLVWVRGGKRNVPLYYTESATGWGCTEDREEGFIFQSRKRAEETWRSKHVNPDQYKAAWDTGNIRTEPLHCPALPIFNRINNE